MFCCHKPELKILQFLRVRKVSKSTPKKKTHEMVKQELLNSLKENDYMGDTGLNETVNKTNNRQEATLLVQRYENTIKTQNKKANRLYWEAKTTFETFPLNFG